MFNLTLQGSHLCPAHKHPFLSLLIGHVVGSQWQSILSSPVPEGLINQVIMEEATLWSSSRCWFSA